jgi:MFS family permease
LFMSVLLGSIHQSRGGAAGGQSIPVIVGTICSACGRLSIGVFSDALLHAMKRIYWAFPMYALMLLGFLLCMFVDSPDIVIAASALVGFGYGGLAGGILPALSADTFGTQHFAKNYSILQPAYPIGFLVWGQACGALYENALAPGNIVCMGTHCHLFVLTLMMCLVAVAVGAAVWLAFITPNARAKRKPSLPMVELNDDFAGAH